MKLRKKDVVTFDLIDKRHKGKLPKIGLVTNYTFCSEIPIILWEKDRICYADRVKNLCRIGRL